MRASASTAVMPLSSVTRPGEFLADRNAITRVWMDHGAWPFLTLLLYIDQTGDFDILLEKQNYFRDCQLSRTQDKDIGWASQYGHKLLDRKGHVYDRHYPGACAGSRI